MFSALLISQSPVDVVSEHNAEQTVEELPGVFGAIPLAEPIETCGQ